MIFSTKNTDDRNCLKPVNEKYVFSQLVSEVNNSSQMSQKGGAIDWGEGEGEGEAYVYVFTEDK